MLLNLRVCCCCCCCCCVQRVGSLSSFNNSASLNSLCCRRLHLPHHPLPCCPTARFAFPQLCMHKTKSQLRYPAKALQRSPLPGRRPCEGVLCRAAKAQRMSPSPRSPHSTDNIIRRPTSTGIFAEAKGTPGCPSPTEKGSYAGPSPTSAARPLSFFYDQKRSRDH
jgi:hypothetical protein